MKLHRQPLFPRALVIAAAALAAALFALSLVPLLTSCASTPAQLERWDKTYHTATNSIARIEPIITTVAPPPWNALAEAALGLISAGLATWNVQQHKRLAALEGQADAAPGAP
ncbi:MAG TPA: hypothetical protein VG167_02935 [Verrucomicrobiae bacterium]|nr:hypothetical protein [Verrucomicrobiae bacterium]